MDQAVLEDAPATEPTPGGITLLPLGVFSAEGDPLSVRRQQQWIWAFLAIGVAVRLVRYLLRFPLWEDEAMLSTNLLDRGYAELLQPLNYCQVCPPLFLWGQATVVRLLGFTEYTLRLIPFACGIASLFLFRQLAGRLLQGAALVLAVGIFAVAYPTVRYTAEAKPYGCDLFLALVMLTLLVHWLRRPGETRWLWCLATIIAPAVGYSFPALFVGGGISLVAAWVLWRSHRRGWLPWIVFNLLLVAAFLALMAVSRTAVDVATQQRMQTEFWGGTFPPLAHPLELIGWFFRIHAGGMLAYPVGGPNWGSTLTMLCCAVGLALLVCRRQWLLLAILLAPLGLNFVAAALHRYPYGGHPRMTLFMAPTFCTLTALGALWIAVTCRRFLIARRLPTVESGDKSPHSNGVIIALFSLLVLVGAGFIMRDLVHPYKSGTTLRAREFARWFWSDLAFDGELVCLETDLKEDLSPGTYRWGWSGLYLCNQRIYSRRHARGEPPRWERVSAAWPLRCVIYRSTIEERDARPLACWLERMQREYELVAHDRYPFPIYERSDRPPDTIDIIEVFKFVPRAAGQAQQKVPSVNGSFSPVVLHGWMPHSASPSP